MGVDPTLWDQPVLVECGFLSNPEEAARLEDPEYQKMVAFTVYSGIIESLK